MTLLIVSVLAGCAGSATRTENIGGRWISVQRGDTLGEIARRAHVPLIRLQRFNPGVRARHLAVGQRLLVPTTRERAPSGGPYRYQIRPGDTFSSIARHFRTQASRIQAANSRLDPQDLRTGQLIQVPLYAASTAGSSMARSDATKSSASSPSAVKRRPSSKPASTSLPGSAKDWPWPLANHRVIREFGPDGRGTLQPMLLDGDTNARAVASGEVRFAGSMRKLGKVVIVHHSDNMQSVYAQCDSLSVENGQRVSQGEILCRVASNGSSPELLFDLRQGGKPINPRRVLR
ncbi:M23 family metallopeptidase [Pistricoccus aurantiacus]|uniref:M23 family metallopeptidase n=1 Tax=Pistricoccus aurantiacus TaxID=1883414 RepID=UPI001FE7F0BB|nr:M23 family metallopeptidase [Pistricoccus aurantiacus]